MAPLKSGETLANSLIQNARLKTQLFNPNILGSSTQTGKAWLGLESEAGSRIKLLASQLPVGND